MERTLTTSAVTTLLMQFIDIFGPLKWLILLAFLIIIADLRWGIVAARKRGEEIRWSRAIRRTINKFLDYVLWIMIAAILGESFGAILDVPIISMIVLGVVYSIELSSATGHYFFVKGIKKRLDLWGLFKGYKIIKDIK